jgi:hypothetical protein
VPAWLAERVGPDGHVVATDIEPSGITAPDGAPIEVRRHDVAYDEPPGDGFDLVHAGRKLPGLLRALGLADVAADAYLPVALKAGAALDAANVMQVRDGLVAQGHATGDEIERHLAALARGRPDVAVPPLVSARGRRA